jgi:hypothetical protein
MSESAVSVSGQPPVALVMLGMHRSGTSALAGLMNLLGVDLGGNLMRPAADNPKGFWEHFQIAGAHADLLGAIGSWFDDYLPLPDGWEKKSEVEWFRDYLRNLLKKEFVGKPLWGFKDPRACRMLALWDELLGEIAVEPRYVLMVRHPDEVAVSMWTRDRYPYNQSLLLMLSHMLEAERHTRGRPRVVVTFDQLMADWRRQVWKIGTALGLQWPRSPDSVAGQVGHFLDPALRHHKAAQVTTAEQATAMRGANPRFAQWAFAAHQAMAAAADRRADIDRSVLDRIRVELRLAQPELEVWRPPRVRKKKLVPV